MKSIVIIFVTLLFGISMVFCNMYKYQLEFINERMFKPCDDYPNNFLDHLFDLDKVNFEFNEDGDLHIFGTVQIVYPFDNKPVPVHGEVFKKERGLWQPTIFSASRMDLCKATFNREEIWHKFTDTIIDEQRKCPFEKMNTFDIDMITDMTFDSPTRATEGEMKIRLKIGEHDINDDSGAFACADAAFIVHNL